ncbi:KDP operon transcriptional regulatory protein KdpE [Hartmannibacter diazotrophicus]|uniref:KDP operon transcriptional regulatory protein KdpE n=1 Tax=Hartmannibacter diazotrophicus TaxID=1482074 RepID=A0A2C9D4F5_9HYPH|nr:response regulator transcription factor [Hartmannibacter diazotrophicus]SON54375.1 KDP operon transcriptional regulatory protein KdpE [Hartmannibacter diazotrophicus]
MSSLARILVVDDESQIRRFLRVALEAHAYEVVEAATGLEAVQKAATESPDIIVLDLGLPDIDGKDVIRRIREWSQTPVLVLSVRQDETEKVEALDAGAQDYVVKPFGIKELFARVRALLRDRTTATGTTAQAVVEVGELRIDVSAHTVDLAGRPLHLTRKEFDVLWMLARNAGRIITHKALLVEIWGKAHEQDTQYLRVFIRQLRQKLGDDPANPRYIMNEPGVGYRMLEPIG